MWPDWQDCGRQVEITTTAGNVVRGELKASDYGFDGEDEYPIFSVLDNAGVYHSFAMADSWKFIETENNVR